MKLYKSLADRTQSSQDTAARLSLCSTDAAALCGYQCANRFQPGCLTSDESVRLHSCEKGTRCSGLDSSKWVQITPVVSRVGDGTVIPELGAGGLEQTHELEVGDTAIVDRLVQLCSSRLGNEDVVGKIAVWLSGVIAHGKTSIPLHGLGLVSDAMEMPLQAVVELLRRSVCSMAELTIERVDGLRAPVPDVAGEVDPYGKELPKRLVRRPPVLLTPWFTWNADISIFTTFVVL